MSCCQVSSSTIISTSLDKKGKFPAKTFHLVLSATLTLSSILGVAAAWVVKKVDQEMNPMSYTSHVTCGYILKSDREVIPHKTLVPRELYGQVCSRVGTKLVRVKSDKSVSFYRSFEEPN